MTFHQTEVTTALIVMEHYHEDSDGAFRKAADKQRESVGSMEWRDQVATIGQNIEKAFDVVYAECEAADKHLPELLDHIGCWDFEIVPELLEQHYGKRSVDWMLTQEHAENLLRVMQQDAL